MSEIALGTKLWWVSSANSREEGEVAVTALDGRRATLSNGAVLDLDNMNAIPDPISRGRCFASQEEHLSSLRLIDEWADFVRDIQGHARPQNMTVEDLRALRLLLRMGENTRRRKEAGA